MGVMLKPDPPLNIGFKTIAGYATLGLIAIGFPSVVLNSVVHNPFTALLFVVWVLFMGIALGLLMPDHNAAQQLPKRDERGRFVKVNNE